MYTLSQVFIIANVFEAELDVDMKWRELRQVTLKSLRLKPPDFSQLGKLTGRGREEEAFIFVLP